VNEAQKPEASRSRLLRPQVLRDPKEEHRTSTWLELFFDLCVVAALARGLHDDPTFGGILRFLGLFSGPRRCWPAWWCWALRWCHWLSRGCSPWRRSRPST
jgi:low temperature requirement protein LtrA